MPLQQQPDLRFDDVHRVLERRAVHALDLARIAQMRGLRVDGQAREHRQAELCGLLCDCLLYTSRCV